MARNWPVTNNVDRNILYHLAQHCLSVSDGPAPHARYCCFSRWRRRHWPRISTPAHTSCHPSTAHRHQSSPRRVSCKPSCQSKTYCLVGCPSVFDVNQPRPYDVDHSSNPLSTRWVAPSASHRRRAPVSPALSAFTSALRVALRGCAALASSACPVTHLASVGCAHHPSHTARRSHWLPPTRWRRTCLPASHDAASLPATRFRYCTSPVSATQFPSPCALRDVFRVISLRRCQSLLPCPAIHPVLSAHAHDFMLDHQPPRSSKPLLICVHTKYILCLSTSCRAAATTWTASRRPPQRLHLDKPVSKPESPQSSNPSR